MTFTAPEWVKENKTAFEYDAQLDLMKGIHPLNFVLSKMEELQSDEIFVLKTGFVPQPLIEKMNELGYQTFTEVVSTSLFHTYIKK